MRMMGFMDSLIVECKEEVELEEEKARGLK